MFERDPDFAQLKKIWTLKLVVEAGGLKQAATRSKVSVSAVSQCISGLEKSLGRKLILRKDRRLLPTQYCRDILVSMEPAFQAFHALETINECPLETPHMSWLDFGASESLAGDILPVLAKHLRAKLPKMKLTLRTGRCAALTTLVKRGELCMALVTENDAMKNVSIFPIFEDRLGLYGSARHSAGTLGFEGLRTLGLATILPENGSHPLYYSRFLRAIGPQTRALLTSDSYEMLYAMACAGTTYAVLPSRLANRTPGLLKEIPLPKAARQPDLGKFKVSMVSETTCDPAEDEFLISELRSLV